MSRTPEWKIFPTELVIESWNPNGREMAMKKKMLLNAGVYLVRNASLLILSENCLEDGNGVVAFPADCDSLYKKLTSLLRQGEWLGRL